MKHIKSTETIAQELGYGSYDRNIQYAAVTGCLSGKIELIANQIDHLRDIQEDSGAFVEDYERAIKNIEMILASVIE